MFYIYDSDTKVFMNETEGQVDPLGGGFFTPVNSTTVAPPSVGVFEAAVFSNGGWLVKVDNRLKNCWHKDTAEAIEFKVGDVVDDTMTELVPVEFPMWSNDMWIQDPVKVREQLLEGLKALYMGVVNAKLKELDYDSLSTVKLWEGDATFGAEASKIIEWYKSIITYNYALLNSGEPYPTESEYLEGMPIYV